MYGLVNQALEQLLRTKFGDVRWAAIRARAKVTPPPVFVGMQAYPDEVTYGLVAAASDELEMPAAELFEALGEYWTIHTARHGYGHLLALGGSTFIDFLQNLDSLHAHVAVSFPELRPPTFWCSDVTDRTVRLHYYSEREGLAPMVVGLVRGLGTMFATNVTVEQAASRAEGAAHDEFQITYTLQA